jgi:hypothetical protein
MINVESIKAIVENIDHQKFGFSFPFKLGLNILTGDNTSGKSTVLSCIYYCLGMEQLASFGSSDGLKECLKSSFKYNEVSYSVFSSYAELSLINSRGEKAVLQRVIKGAYQEDTNIIRVKINEGTFEDKFVHAIGDTDHKNGFYKWLSEYSEIPIPIYIDDEDGVRKKILYLQQIFSSSFVEQTKGWSDFFAQIPNFNTKNAKQKIIEYTLGLSSLIEEFELDKLKEREKEYKVLWSNTVENFQSLISYNNFLTINLPAAFSIDYTPKKIENLKLQTRLTDGGYSDLESIVKSMHVSLNEIIEKNNGIGVGSTQSTHLLKNHSEIAERLQHLTVDYENIKRTKLNEEIKINNYQSHLEQLNRQIEFLEGFKKLKDLALLETDSIENCPVCNSSLLTKLDTTSSKVDFVNSAHSLEFYKSEKSLYESYLNSSRKLTARFDKTCLYYEGRITETKEALDILNRQLIEDSRIPSRIDIREEMRLKLELEKIEKIDAQFTSFKAFLIELSKILALIRHRKNELKENISIDVGRLDEFRQKFVELLESFGYSQEILYRIYISTTESYKLFPVVNGPLTSTPQPIRLVSSASDFIRAQWAFYITLLLEAKLHLGILILDEPGQHAIASRDLIQLLKVASSIKDRQIIIAISKEDKVRLSTTNNGEQGEEVKIDLLEILDESGLVEDEDYTLNMIDGHGRKDKCIQPID